MKLIFSWLDIDGSNRAACESDVTNQEGFSHLAGILMDDGGLSRVRQLAWIDEGIARIDCVLKGEKPIETWGRETLEAELKADLVRISFYSDENHAQVVTTASFRRALVAWNEFLKLPVQRGVVREIDL